MMNLVYLMIEMDGGFVERESEMEEEVESFVKWAAELGISDSPDAKTHSCLGHSLSLSYFPEAGGYVRCVSVIQFQFQFQFLISN
jgi:hypothetical protein